MNMLQFFQDKGASVELAELMVELASAAARIAGSIQYTSTGKAGSKNAYGEEQMAMDLQADQIMQQHMQSCPFVAAYASEESELQSYHEGGSFVVVSDPLDGSSLLDVNFAVGTIVGVYPAGDLMGRSPRDQVAAMYTVYGPHTTLVVTVGGGVHEFTLHVGGEEGDDYEWKLTAESLQVDGKKKYFAPGNLRACKEREDYFDLVSYYVREQYTLRYSGGMVPDINHILKKGSGVFMYPGMPGAENGKLRVLYECGPMALIMEQAGGASSDGSQSILDVEITDMVQRCPIFVGQKDQVKKAEEVLG